MFVPFQLTEDKLEHHMSVNYFSHCLLVIKLLPLLTKKVSSSNQEPSRIVMVTSGAHHASYGLRLNDLNSQNLYSIYHAYAQSKLALIMFTYYFCKWMQQISDQQQIMPTINCLHPGICRTELMNNFNFFKLKFIQESPLFRVSVCSELEFLK